MECLAAGRAHLAARRSARAWRSSRVRATGGYARVRQQFKTPIGRFEGIEEPLARIGGNLYMMDATRMLTAAAVDLGEKPAVLSGIAKLPPDRARARRSSTTRWTSSAARASAWARRTSSARAYMQHAGRDHRRGREHPDAQPDHLRPGRDPLPSVRAEGDRARRATPTARRRVVAFDAALFGHLRLHAVATSRARS